MTSEQGLPRVEFEDIVSGEGRLNKDLATKRSSKTGVSFEPGDVLYGKLRPYLKNWLHADFPGVAVGDFWVLEPLNVNSDYLYALVQSDAYQEAANITAGSKMPRANWSVVSELEVSLPSDTEQANIGRLFSDLDNLIEASRRRHYSLTSLKKTMLVKLFPQGTASTPEVRFEGFEGDWGTRPLGELGSIKTGPFGSTLHAEDYVSHGTPIITTEHFKTGNLTTYLPTLPQVSAKDRARLAGYSLTEGDIVFSRVGSVDVNAVVRPEHEGWLFSGRVLRVRLETEVDYEYLHWCLLTPVLREDITSRAVGQTMPSINTRILADTVVPVPSLPEQQAIGAYFRSLDGLIEAEQKKLTTLRNLKNALLTQMFV